MAQAQEQRKSDGRRSLPGRFSALLRELAHVPESEIGSGWDRAPAPGTVIGRFELLREVGRGGFGVVYEARDRDLGRTVAFKLVLPGKDLAVREERLLREAESAARLSHPNIVTLFDVGRSDLGPHLVLEFLRGKTLAERLREGPMPVAEALRIAVEVAKGVAHAHANGVVHRDLTPGNVFLCDDGQVKVLDLGMAHAFGHHRVGGGTPGYMAPEQERGAPEDERTDVFTLGAILHRMLAGEPAFPRTADGTVGAAPVLDVPGLPGLGELVASMLEEDPVRRPRDMGAVLASLAAFVREMEDTPTTGKVAVRSRRRRRIRRIAGALAAMLVGVAAAWAAQRLLRGGGEEGPSIAVLPFADLSPKGDQEYFSDGLADAILVALTRVEGLRVPGRTSSFHFKGKNPSLAEIERELNVATVLEGSVRRSGNRVRVTAEVVNVADGFRRWARTYDRELTDVFAVQDEIARSVVDALELKLLDGTLPAGPTQTKDPEAYAQYLLGRQQYHLLTSVGYGRAIEAYERAIARDPGYAPAWAGLAISLYNLSVTDAPGGGAPGKRRALAAAEKAVELSPDLAEGLAVRGVARAYVSQDWAGGKADLERALALNPNDPDNRRRYGTLLYEMGKLPEAISEMQKAVDLDPLGLAWAHLGSFYQEAGDLTAADAAFRRHLQLSPDSFAGALNLARNLLLQRRPKEALTVFDGRPEENYRLWVVAMAEHEMGHANAADAALEALVAKHGSTAAFGIAEAHAWRGDKDEAFEWLERAGPTGDLRRDPFLASLRGDPRFDALLRKLNLPAK